MSDKNEVKITDKELLTFCNLANLEMEYANLTQVDPKTNKKINHTIYSLLSQERNENNIGDLDIDFDKRDENKDRDYIINLYKIFRERIQKIEDAIDNEKILKLEKEKEELLKNSILISKYEAPIIYKELNIEEKKRKIKEKKIPEYMYEKGKEIIRSAPIVFDYLDNPKLNGFLKEWEIVYAENLQGITLDYIYHLYNLISKNNLTKEEFLIKTELDKKIIETQNNMINEEIPIEFNLDFKKSLLIGQCDYLLNYICYSEIFHTLSEDISKQTKINKIDFKLEKNTLKILKINIKNCKEEKELDKYSLILQEKNMLFLKEDLYIILDSKKSKIPKYIEKGVSFLTAFGNDQSDYQNFKKNRIKNTLEEENLLGLLEKSNGEISEETLLEIISKIENKNTSELNEIQSQLGADNIFKRIRKSNKKKKHSNYQQQKIPKKSLSRKDLANLANKKQQLIKVNTSLNKVTITIKKTGIIGKILGIKGVSLILKALDTGTKLFAWYTFFKELYIGLENIKNLYIEPKITIESLKLYKSDLRMIILKKQEKYTVVFNNFKDKELEKVISTGVVNQTLSLISCALNNFFLEGEYSEKTTSLEIGIKNLNEKLQKKDITFIGFGKGGDLAQVFSYLYCRKNKTLVENSSNILNIRNIVEINEQDLEMITNQHETLEIFIKEIFEITISSIVGDNLAIASTIVITAVTILLKGVFLAVIESLSIYCIAPIIIAKIIIFMLKSFNLRSTLKFLKKQNYIEEINGIYLATEKINKNLINSKDESLGFVIDFIKKYYAVKSTISEEKGYDKISYALCIFNNQDGTINYNSSFVQRVYESTTNYNYKILPKDFIKSELDLKSKLILYWKEEYSKAIGIYNLLKYYYLLREKNLIIKDDKINRKQNTELIWIEYKDLTDYSKESLGREYHIYGTQYKPVIKRETRLDEILKMNAFSKMLNQKISIDSSEDKEVVTGLIAEKMYSKKDLERIETAKTEDEKSRLREETKIDLSEIDVLNVFDDEYRFFPFLNGDNLTTDINDNFSKSALTSDVQSNYGDKPIEKVEKKEEDISSSKDKEVESKEEKEKREVPSEDKEIEKKEVIETTKTIKTEKEKTANTTNSTTKANVIQYEVVKFPTEKRLEKNKKTIAMVETLVKRGGARIPYLKEGILGSIFIIGLERYFSIKEARNETEKTGTIIFNDKDEEQPSYKFHEATRFHNKKVELKIPLIEDPNDVVEDKTEVLDGAVLRCSLGTDPSNLEVTTHNKVYVKNRLVGTVEDCKGGENIKSFGECRRSNPCPCIPKIEGIWKKGSEKVYIKDKAVLLSNAKCKCKDGGEIRIEQPLGKVDILK